jgi:hypothetical protein
MSGDRVFFWIGVAASIGGVAFLLSLSPLADWVEAPWRRLRKFVHARRVDWMKHGVRKGIRYRIGVRLLMPYMDARYRHWKRLHDEIHPDPEGDPLTFRIETGRRERIMGSQLELIGWLRLDGGGERPWEAGRD